MEVPYNYKYIIYMPFQPPSFFFFWGGGFLEGGKGMWRMEGGFFWWALCILNDGFTQLLRSTLFRVILDIRYVSPPEMKSWAYATPHDWIDFPWPRDLPPSLSPHVGTAEGVLFKQSRVEYRS